MVWAAEAVCERPGSRVGLWGAPCPRGVARLWLGVERGGFCTSCGSIRSSEADHATRVWTCVAAPARGGQVGGWSGGVQRLRNLGGRRGARVGLYTFFSPSTIYILLLIFSPDPLYSREYSRILRIFSPRGRSTEAKNRSKVEVCAPKPLRNVQN